MCPGIHHLPHLLSHSALASLHCQESAFPVKHKILTVSSSMWHADSAVAWRERTGMAGVSISASGRSGGAQSTGRIRATSPPGALAARVRPNGRVLRAMRVCDPETPCSSHDWECGSPQTALSDRRRTHAEHDQAIERVRRALAIAADLGDRGLHAVASYFAGINHLFLGDYPRAAEVLRGTIACLEGDLARELLGLSAFPAVLARGMLGYALGIRGEFVEGIAQGEEAVRTADAIDHLYSIGIVCSLVGWVYLDKGDVQKSIPYLERSLHLGQVGSFSLTFDAASALGCAYAMSGRIADALPLLDQCASQDLLEIRINSGPRLYLKTGEGYLLAGRPDEATQMALRARDLAQQRRERGRLAEALRLLGEIATYRDPPEAESAEVHY